MGRFSFSGKTAIVTGASSGIGWATALALSKKGVCLALGARSTPALEELATQICSQGGEAFAYPTDVTRQDQVQSLVAETLRRWGKIDLLVADAGEYIPCPVAELDVETLERSLAVNFFGGVHAVLAVLPHMLAQHSGHIVLVLTVDAQKALTPDAPYVSAKFALRGFGETLRQELYRTGVSLSIIYPGRVDTPMIDNLKFSWVSPKIPAEDVAKSILSAIERRRVQVILPGRARLLVYVNYFFPTLADAAARRLHLQGWEI